MSTKLNKNNLKPNNLKPFVNTNVIKSFNFKDLIVENTNIDELLPLFPSIYFQNNQDNLKDNIGSTIINTYYNITFNLNKLNIIKNFIISILESSKYDLEKIKISREKYKLFKHNLFFDFKNNSFFDFSDNISTKIMSFSPFSKNKNKSIKTQDDFKKFVEKYKDNKYGLLKDNLVADIPYFFKIFQSEYQNNSDSKTYFINLLKKYMDIRKLLIKNYIENNYGLCAFKFIFDLSNTQTFAKIKEIEKKKLSQEKKKNNKIIPYNNFILYGKNLGFNQNNNDFKVGDILKKIIPIPTPSPVSLTTIPDEPNVEKYIIYNIDFKNSPDKPYTLQILYKNKNPPILLSISNEELTTYYELNWKVGDVLEKITPTPTPSIIPTPIPDEPNVEKYIIYNIDFIKSPNKPYTLQILYKNKNPPIVLQFSQEELDIFFKLIIRNKISKDLVNKIHSLDLLYVTVATQQYYKDEYIKNIELYYSNLNKSLDDYVGSGFSNNLYHVLISGIESDFNMLQFIFNYTDPNLFSKIVDLHIMIKNFISNKINKFEQYYDAYIEWYEVFKGISTKLKFDFGATPDSDFKSFFDKLFTESTGEKI
jgi:hypothetical protein